MQAWTQLFLPLPPSTTKSVTGDRFLSLRPLRWMERRAGEILLCTPPFVSAAQGNNHFRSTHHRNWPHSSNSPLLFFVRTSGKTMETRSLEPPGLFASILSTKSWLLKLFSQYFPCSVCRGVECRDVYKNPQGWLVERLGVFLLPPSLI